MMRKRFITNGLRLWKMAGKRADTVSENSVVIKNFYPELIQFNSLLRYQTTCLKTTKKQYLNGRSFRKINYYCEICIFIFQLPHRCLQTESYEM